jgi:hypothetical protein
MAVDLAGPPLLRRDRANVRDPWGEPVNLGPTVNTPDAETRASLSGTGMTLVFGSNRSAAN